MNITVQILSEKCFSENIITKIFNKVFGARGMNGLKSKQ